MQNVYRVKSAYSCSMLQYNSNTVLYPRHKKLRYVTLVLLDGDGSDLITKTQQRTKMYTRQVAQITRSTYTQNNNHNNR